MGNVGQLGMQAGMQIGGAALGLLLGEYNDKRQMEQQERLQELQMRGQKEMSNYQYNQQMRMWKETNYAAQMAELKKAGLNPGLMYAQGGAGGSTAAGTGASVTGGSAPVGGGEVVAAQGMALQLGMMQAQKEVLETQAEKNRADTEAKRGFETKESEARQESILQGVDNLRQTHELQKLELTMKNIENFEKQASQGDRLDYIEYQTRIAEREMKILGNQNKISDETVQDNIKRIKAESIGAVLKNILTQSQTNKTESDIQVNNQTIKSRAQELMMNWDKMNMMERELRIKEALKDWTTDPNREAISQALNSMQTIIGAAKKGTTIINSYE